METATKAAVDAVGEALVSSWYAVQTKPRGESLLSAALQSAGLETYCPRIRRRSIHSGRKRVKEVPLFPGYLFVRCLFSTDYPRIRWTPGLVRLVSSGGSPVEVGEEMMEEIRRIERLGARLRLGARSFAPGSPVRVVRGPFTGFEGR